VRLLGTLELCILGPYFDLEFQTCELFANFREKSQAIEHITAVIFNMLWLNLDLRDKTDI